MKCLCAQPIFMFELMPVDIYKSNKYSWGTTVLQSVLVRYMIPFRSDSILGEKQYLHVSCWLYEKHTYVQPTTQRLSQ